MSGPAKSRKGLRRERAVAAAALVVAGVPFLRDGQQVTLLNPSHGG